MILLTDQEMANILDVAVNEKKSMLASRKDIAKAQLKNVMIDKIGVWILYILLYPLMKALGRR